MLFALLFAVAALLLPASAATWYFLRYNLPSTQAFLSFSGTMQIPKLPKAGTYQNVLDGRSGTWWIGSGWCCSNPSLPWGGGFNTYQGESVTFSNVKDSSGNNWTSKLTRGSSSVTNSFALGSKTFNQVLFAIELTGVSWDFGPLVFNNVVITSSGTDTKWCTNAPENYNSASNYAISGVSASVSGKIVTCKINSVTLQSPK
ncbi:hypothetical protein BU23DRAFT_586592 [Bimuria novae-zelandiae CBS 107.79]|uniref:Concanavalin A-like lectin/glucanase n=1 Tax=Bimuria novae-zelandiae CBS 107.79 TaxID=1447943 RepID=A0A6A5VNR6_9PLEO|nr:hypothetical protein BU23DRAFT_586592 [Bimuria novae-zelandiae CBS 107.79]